ncbi:hypothetical protein TNCV_367511 [Trichonephila clavipes]|nr:hypothetical protein TNCV_367511 [Trichonephila clavipes]
MDEVETDQARLSASSVESLANQRLHLARDEIYTLDADSLGGNAALNRLDAEEASSGMRPLYPFYKDMHN